MLLTRKLIAPVTAASVATGLVLALGLPAGAAPSPQPQPAQPVTVTNTADSPVPVTGSTRVSNATSDPVPVAGSVNVGTVSGSVAVVPTVPPATQSAGIPVQSLTPGSDYTFLGANYAMASSFVTVWTSELISVDFGGQAPLVLTTDEPMALALTQPNLTGSGVKVTCLATVPCRFSFHITGS